MRAAASAFRVACRVLLLASAGAALPAPPDAGKLVASSIWNGERAWRNSLRYFCTKEDVTRQFASDGRVKSVDDDVYHVIPLGYGSSYELHVSHNGTPVGPSEAARQQRELAALRAEPPEQKRKRFAKALSDRSYMLEVATAFNFKIVGEERMATGPVWVVEATPRAGFQAKSRYAHVFPSMRGRLWIDQRDGQWVRADAVASQTVSFGFFIARLSKGSHIILEQARLPDGAWVPSRIEARASARTFIFFSHNFRETIQYKDYRLDPSAAPAPAMN